VYAFVRGILHSVGLDHAVIEAGGVGYLIYAPRRVLANLGEAGAQTLLHTHLYVREDVMALYGFATPDELKMFVALLGVSGIGPKVALSMLSAATPAELQLAIANGDTKVLARVPGIGQKTAARLVLELKGKLDLAALAGAPGSTPALGGINNDLADMLVGLGFSAAEAAAAIASLPADAPPDLEERLRLALRFFGGA
jgi:holliday junction DNA helicase RuvA